MLMQYQYIIQFLQKYLNPNTVDLSKTINISLGLYIVYWDRDKTHFSLYRENNGSIIPCCKLLIQT